MIYLLTGEDELSKQEKILSLKKQLFPPDSEGFNYDSFYPKELTLSLLKELFVRLPVSAKQRLLVIKDALKLKDELQEYILSRVKDFPPSLVLVLDVSRIPSEPSRFISAVLKSAKVISFKTRREINAFDLASQIERGNAGGALNILSDLLAGGERPERILGALRYQFVRPRISLQERRKKIALLLESDKTLKTGKMPAEFVLEALVVRLCRG